MSKAKKQKKIPNIDIEAIPFGAMSLDTFIESQVGRETAGFVKSMGSNEPAFLLAQFLIGFQAADVRLQLEAKGFDMDEFHEREKRKIIQVSMHYVVNNSKTIISNLGKQQLDRVMCLLSENELTV